MKVKLSLVIQNHLSDATIIMIPRPGTANDYIKFVKKLITKYPDTNVYVDETELDEMWSEIKK
jgi:hypothetical protein